MVRWEVAICQYSKESGNLLGRFVINVMANNETEVRQKIANLDNNLQIQAVSKGQYDPNAKVDNWLPTDLYKTTGSLDQQAQGMISGARNRIISIRRM